MIRLRLVAGFVTATALVTLAACGSSTKSSSTTKSTTASASASTTAPPATTAAPTAGSTAAGSVATTATKASTPTGSTEASADSVDLPNINDTIDVSVPANASGDCKTLYTNLINSAGGADGTAKLDDLYKALEKQVPADLKDDVETLRTAFENYQTAVTKAGGGAAAASDPDVQKAEAALGDENIQTATTNLTAWFDKTCPELAGSDDSVDSSGDVTATT